MERKRIAAGNKKLKNQKEVYAKKKEEEMNQIKELKKSIFDLKK